MIRYCEQYRGRGKTFVLATSILLLLSIFILFYHGYVEATNNAVDNTQDHNQINYIEGYVIKYSGDGGFTGRHDYIWYNSTTNHLISNYKSNISLYELGLSNALFDLQLSDNQQKNLSKLITDGSFFNISFNNNGPDCCDISYYRLEIITAHKMNSVRWTSGNILDDTYYKRLPSIVTNIVDTLEKYTTDSIPLFSESRIKDKFEIKREILYEANLLLAQKNYTQADLLYSKALEIDSNDVDALVYKAHSLIGLGQLEDAKLLIDKALSIQSGNIYTLIAKAIVLTKMGQEQQAIIWIDKALEIDPKNANALEMKKEILESMK